MNRLKAFHQVGDAGRRKLKSNIGNLSFSNRPKRTRTSGDVVMLCRVKNSCVLISIFAFHWFVWNIALFMHFHCCHHTFTFCLEFLLHCLLRELHELCELLSIALYSRNQFEFTVQKGAVAGSPMHCNGCMITLGAPDGARNNPDSQSSFKL